MDFYGINVVFRMEFVYGKGVWKLLDEEEKWKKVISMGVILGGVWFVCSVVVVMVIEVVCVVFFWKSRELF